MATRPKGLGRGLGELFLNTDNETSVSRAIDTAVGFSSSAGIGDGSWFEEIPVIAISTNPLQPRQVFDDDELAELAASIADVGLLQPIVVRPHGEGYELVMGERRLRAHRLAHIDVIPAIVRATDDDALLRDALFENLHRVQLNPIEEAAAYQQLLDDFGGTQEELATRLHKSRPHISNTIRLLRLAPSLQRKVASGVLSAGHARALVGLNDAAAQERLAERIVAEGLSVRSTEELIALGETGSDKPERTEKAPKESDPEVAQLVANVSDALDTRVTVTVGKNKGRLVIEFADIDDLARITRAIAG
ncbi:MAG: ParB/RepB/Spo0J family partition protein [Propionibacteriaceae bacterium]|jgi:ParB family chromosome partitioning protein|nr:ParB/RepB/Spo0J family partition protein [Propionibacteriaceae bacterium]